MHTRDTRWTTSEALDLMRRPRREYASRAAIRRDASWAAALTVPVLLAVLLGIVTAAATTGRVVASLVVSQIVCWGFVPLLQVITGSILIATVRERPVTLARGLELLFAAHGPWSIWLVLIGFQQTVMPNRNVVLGSSLIPFAWTGWMLDAYCGEVLGLTPTQTRVRVALHQAATVALIVIYMEFATRLSVRVIGAFQ